MWWFWLRRWWWAYKLKGQRGYDLFSAPLPARYTAWDEVEWLAVDLETTSLDVNVGEIVSIGWVPMRAGRIQLAEAEHHVLGIRREIGQSAVFHGITDSDVAAGKRAGEMFERFARVARGRVLVFHNATLDMAYLNKLSLRLIGAPLVVPVVDTLLWEKARVLKRYDAIPRDALRLHSCRQRYNLPDYPAHNALVDAFATLELLMAQIVYLGEKPSLSEIIERAS